MEQISQSLWQLVRAMREERIPRNRHYELHRSAVAKQARRIHRFLRAVERDVLRSTEVRVSRRAEGGVRIELELDALRARRVIELEAHAHSILLEDNAVAERLQAPPT